MTLYQSYRGSAEAFITKEEHYSLHLITTSGMASDRLIAIRVGGETSVIKMPYGKLAYWVRVPSEERLLLMKLLGVTVEHVHI